jgi:hypothetical protein
MPNQDIPIKLVDIITDHVVARAIDEYERMSGGSADATAIRNLAYQIAALTADACGVVLEV